VKHFHLPPNCGPLWSCVAACSVFALYMLPYSATSFVLKQCHHCSFCAQSRSSKLKRSIHLNDLLQLWSSQESLLGADRAFCHPRRLFFHCLCVPFHVCFASMQSTIYFVNTYSYQCSFKRAPPSPLTGLIETFSVCCMWQGSLPGIAHLNYCKLFLL